MPVVNCNVYGSNPSTGCCFCPFLSLVSCHLVLLSLSNKGQKIIISLQNNCHTPSFYLEHIYWLGQLLISSQVYVLLNDDKQMELLRPLLNVTLNDTRVLQLLQQPKVKHCGCSSSVYKNKRGSRWSPCLSSGPLPLGMLGSWVHSEEAQEGKS